MKTKQFKVPLEKIPFFVLICILMILSMKISVAHADVTPVTHSIGQEMLTKGTYKKSCPLIPERLSIVTFKYIDFAGVVHNDGKIMVMDAAATHVENIFNELLAIKFPIAKSKLIEAYNGEDELSLADNNTAGFNCRKTTKAKESFLQSMHSYGLAIDINPVQNPYVIYDNKHNKNNKEKNYAIVLPKQGAEYLNRENVRAGMAEKMVAIFKNNGFSVWGGNWNNPIDWQHFQTSRAVARLLVVMSADDAKEFFNLYVKTPKLFNEIHYNDDRFIKLYQKNPKRFMQIINTKFVEINRFSVNDALKYMQNLI